MKKIIILLSFLMIFSCSKTEKLEKNTEKINSWKIEESTEILKEDFQKWEKIVLPWKVHFSYENWEIITDNKEVKIEKLEKLPGWLMTWKNCEENEVKEKFWDFSFCVNKSLEKDFFDYWEIKFLTFKKENKYLFDISINEKKFSPSNYEEHWDRDNLRVKISSYKNFLFIDEFHTEDSFHLWKYKSSFFVIFSWENVFAILYNKKEKYLKNFLETLKIEK